MAPLRRMRMWWPQPFDPAPRAPAETRHVASWINAMGALQGTPLVDDRLFPDMEIFMGKVDVAGTDSMATPLSRRRFDFFRIPEHILVVNYFGIPVVGSVSFLAR